MKRPDLEQLKVDLKLRQLAIDEARSDSPSTTDTLLDSAQEHVVHIFSQMYNMALEETEQFLSGLKLKRKELAGEIHENHLVAEFQAVPARAKRSISELEAEKHDHLKGLRLDELKALRHYRGFKADNHLTREAHYPDSAWLHWSIVIAAVLIESIVNSYFFKEATDTGYLGGIFVAALISLVNVTVAVLLGRFLLPQFNLARKWPRAYFASVGAVGCLVVILLINLAAAHTRAILSPGIKAAATDTQAAFSTAVVKLKEAPFQINNLEAWILFVIGLSIAFVAAWKGYTSDDRYPRYGLEDRLLKRVQKAYARQKDDCTRLVISRVKGVEEEMQRTLVSVRQQVKHFQASLEASHLRVRELEGFYGDLNAGCNSLLRYYREINRSIRTSQPPKYFAEEVKIDHSVRLLATDIAEEDLGKRYQELLLQLEQLNQKSFEALGELQQQYLNRLPDLYRQWETEADAQLKKEEKI